mmetsp:Transcript_24037/g.27718  ORF Transcript_24037/g.27718 Transcript_24037/m.27718 type:complete len:245 (+) Transcript_24037:790-1524(+)
MTSASTFSSIFPYSTFSMISPVLSRDCISISSSIGLAVRIASLGLSSSVNLVSSSCVRSSFLREFSNNEFLLTSLVGRENDFLPEDTNVCFPFEASCSSIDLAAGWSSLTSLPEQGLRMGLNFFKDLMSLGEPSLLSPGFSGEGTRLRALGSSFLSCVFSSFIFNVVILLSSPLAVKILLFLFFGALEASLLLFLASGLPSAKSRTLTGGDLSLSRSSSFLSLSRISLRRVCRSLRRCPMRCSW